MTIIAESRSAPQTYSAAARWVHWIMAVLILANIPGGLVLEHLPEGPVQNLGYDLHRSTGALILALAVIRLAIRLVAGAPAPVPTLTTFERVVSAAVHKALYVLIFLVPLIGWAATSAYGAAISVYGLFILPPILPHNEPLSDVLFKVHKLSAILLGALAGLHIAGALFHVIIRRDGVMARMLPGQ